MKITLFVFVLFIATSAFSQEKYLSISDSSNGKEKVFKQNKRVRVKTIEGGKLNGKLKIMNDEQVMIKNIIIPLTSIEKIKNNPLALNILITGTMLYFGTMGIVGGLIITAWSETASGLVLIIPGAAMIYGGLKSINFLPYVLLDSNSTIKVGNFLE